MGKIEGSQTLIQVLGLLERTKTSVFEEETGFKETVDYPWKTFPWDGAETYSEIQCSSET